MRRVGRLFERLVSDENLLEAINQVNGSHHWRTHHRPNGCTAWVEETKQERVKDLRKILTEGFQPKEPHVTERWDASARKWRTVSEPAQWPDQYIHHALVQVLEPVMMRGMDPYCCGSIKDRGTLYGADAISRWMEHDVKGTRYVLCCDVYHFYESLQPDVVMDRMRKLVKDRRVLDVIWDTIKGGILIGAYTSQWFANTLLQPLDQMIRESGLCAHYVRYMDNLTISGPNKRKLRRLKGMIEDWLAGRKLRLKGDWQLYPVAKQEPKEPLKPPRNGVSRAKGRMPDGMGYRYGRGYRIPRKHNLLRVKRALSRVRRRMRLGLKVFGGQAVSVLSRLGQLKHCNNVSLYGILFRGERIVRTLKQIARERARKEALTWSTYLARRARASA